MLLFCSYYIHPTAQLPHTEEERFPLHFEDLGTEGRCATSGLRDEGFQIEDVQLLRQGERE